MKEESNDKNLIFQSVNVDEFADNTHQKGKTKKKKKWNNTIRITANVVFIESNLPPNIQYIESFLSTNWFFKTLIRPC